MADEPDDATADGATTEPASNGGADGMVNSQVMDAVTALNTIGLGEAPTTAAAMLAMVSANTIGLSMYNAVARQQADAALHSAAMASTCARLVGTQARLAPVLPAQALVAAAEAQAQASIAVLKAQAAQPGDAAADAAQALKRLAAEAAAETAQSGGQPK